ncbi:sterile alpha motif domain-containing protein 3 isoform X1 [Rhipicephalus microplus]|uniref:Protein ovary overexpressed n=1 Tax=Rhipicephalus microplus TaxID=6941 RepID=A0A6M2CVI1_RHIMP|nr:uncharacterized protein LOC119178784 [Rhipicephalus microplus]
MASKCLVEFRDKKVVVNFDGSLTRQQLFDNLRASGVIVNVDTARLRLRVYDEDFSTFVDVTDDFVIKDKFKVQLDEVSEYWVADVLDMVEVARLPPQIGPVSVMYTLPPVPLDIQMAVETHQRGMHLEKRRRVIEWLFRDLCSYGMHPGKLYEEAAKALVRKFPNLADCTGTGYDSWREALRFKGKYERRKMRIHRGEIVPTKKHRSDGTMTIHEPVLKRVTRPTTVTEVWGGEDESGVESHIASMKTELAKTKPDLSYVTDRMLRTFVARRNWIENGCPSIQAITDEYPALKLSSMLHNEFKLQTGVDLRATLQPLLRAIEKKVLDIAQKKRHLEAFLADLDKRLKDATEDDKVDLMQNAVICLLPCLVKERKEAFVNSVENIVYAVPSIVCLGNVLDCTYFKVCVENYEVVETTLTNALATLLALYWAFDIVFAKGAQKTFEVLGKLLGIPGSGRISPLARVAHTMLQACLE